jgi:hypothetical protein
MFQHSENMKIWSEIPPISTQKIFSISVASIPDKSGLFWLPYVGVQNLEDLSSFCHVLDDLSVVCEEYHTMTHTSDLVSTGLSLQVTLYQLLDQHRPLPLTNNGGSRMKVTSGLRNDL